MARKPHRQSASGGAFPLAWRSTKNSQDGACGRQDARASVAIQCKEVINKHFLTFAVTAETRFYPQPAEVCGCRHRKPTVPSRWLRARRWVSDWCPGSLHAMTRAAQIAEATSKKGE